MTRDEYLAIRDNQEADNLPVLYFFFQLKGGTGIPSLAHFGEAFGVWILKQGLGKLRLVHEYVDRELNKHFNLN